ncbi:Antigen 43 precursor [Escherichia coli O157:H7 str. EDL933]|nr:Antigen 43 precursor [Escherichia coli O157:H7 str. EDL933]
MARHWTCQAGLEARIRENITLGVQAGYAHSVSGSSAEGYNGQATLNMDFLIIRYPGNTIQENSCSNGKGRSLLFTAVLNY